MAEQPPITRKRTIQAVEPPREPWKTPACDPADIGALRAVYQGNAAEHQQRRAMDFIIKELCGVGKVPWVPGGLEGARATDFACGRLQVGQEIVALIAANVSRGGENG